MTRWTPSFEPVEAPSSLWGSLVKSGYGIVYALEVEGIPYLFTEREMWTTRGVAAGYHNLDDLTISHALVISEGDRYDQACNREEGLAAGRAVDFTIGRQQLADESLGPLLFARPTLRSTLTLAVTDPDMDTFEVDDTTGWDATGLMYIGRECVKYTSLTDTSFGGCQRGVAGMPHYHTASTASAYRQCTDTPVYWRGRLVTLWEHLVSPEGRYLGERWAELGLWCRQAWRGEVRDTPRPEQAGMVLTCLPLPRIAAQEFGAEISGKMRPDWIVSDPGDVVIFSNPSLYAAYSVPRAPIETNNGIVSLATWAAIAENHAAVEWRAQFEITPTRLLIRIAESQDTDAVSPYIVGPSTTVVAQAWFLDPGQVSSTNINPWTTGGPTAGGYIYSIPLTFIPAAGGQAGAWIVVELEPQADYSDALVGETGLLALDVGGHIEIASYDETRLSSDSTKRAFRLSGRELLGTSSSTGAHSYANPWLNDTTVRVISGTAGQWEEALRTLLTSSGTGDRGDFDTLPHGFGLGLPDEWFASGPQTGIQSWVNAVIQQRLTAVTTGKTSARDLLCGWLAALSACLVQRRQDDGAMVLDVVSTAPDNDPTGEALTEADVLLDGHETPEMMEAPNHIRIVTGDLLNERPTHIVRDSARAQAEGVRSLEIKAPSMTGDQALLYGASLMLIGDGQAAVRMRLPPWVEIQIGDARELTSAHPAVWDWSTGTYAPASVMGRVVEHGRELWSQVQDVTLLLAGQAQERVFLCPCALVTQAVSTTVYRVEAGGAVGFAVGDEVLFYERSNEDADTGTATITAIVEGTDYDTITVDADPAVDGAEIVITFDVYANAVTRQRRHMFAQTDKAWR